MFAAIGLEKIYPNQPNPKMLELLTLNRLNKWVITVPYYFFFRSWLEPVSSGGGRLGRGWLSLWSFVQIHQIYPHAWKPSDQIDQIDLVNLIRRPVNSGEILMSLIKLQKWISWSGLGVCVEWVRLVRWRKNTMYCTQSFRCLILKCSFERLYFHNSRFVCVRGQRSDWTSTCRVATYQFIFIAKLSLLRKSNIKIDISAVRKTSAKPK